MAILEINLEKPALIEEYRFPAESSAARAVESSESDTGESSSGSLKGKLVGLLAVAAGIGLLVWKLKSRGGDQTDLDEFETEDETPEWETEADDDGGSKGKVAGLLGLAVAAVGLVAAVQKRRS